MTDVINHKQLAKILRKSWRDDFSINVAARKHGYLISNGYLLFSLPHGAETIRRLPEGLFNMLCNLPQGSHVIKRDAVSKRSKSLVQWWNEYTAKQNRVEELTRTDVLYNPNSVVSHEVYVRYYSPKFWIDRDYDQCINHDARRHILYYRNKEGALIAEGPDGPFAAIMPMVLNHNDVHILATDYAPEREVVTA